MNKMKLTTKPKPANEEESKNKTYLCVLIIDNEQLFAKNIVIAKNTFDALLKYSTKFANEELELSSVRLEIEEVEILR